MRRRGRFALSKRGGRRRILSRSSNGPINTKYTYKSTNRRPSKVNRSFNKAVKMAGAKLYRFTDVSNHQFPGNNGQAVWGELSVGFAVEIGEFCERLRQNYLGYNVLDPNTTTAGDNQLFMNYHIDSLAKYGFFINNSECRVHVSAYECTPRSDMAGDTPYSTPLAFMNNNFHTGELVDSVIYDGVTPGTMLLSDPRSTPFMCPKLCSKYIIKHHKAFTVHPGGRFNLNVSSNNFDANYYNSFYSGDGYNHFAKRGQTKVILFKFWGELGVVEDETGVAHLRNMAFNVVSRHNYICKGRAGEDTRTIYQDILL